MGTGTPIGVVMMIGGPTTMIVRTTGMVDSFIFLLLREDLVMMYLAWIPGGQWSKALFSGSAPSD